MKGKTCLSAFDWRDQVEQDRTDPVLVVFGSKSKSQGHLTSEYFSKSGMTLIPKKLRHRLSHPRWDESAGIVSWIC